MQESCPPPQTPPRLGSSDSYRYYPVVEPPAKQNEPRPGASALCSCFKRVGTWSRRFEVTRIVRIEPAPAPLQTERKLGPWADHLPEPLRDVVPAPPIPVDIEGKSPEMCRVNGPRTPAGNKGSLFLRGSPSAGKHDGIAGSPSRPHEPIRGRSGRL